MALLLSLKRTVDLEPGLTTPQVFHVSQNDVGTRLYVGLEQGGTAYTIPENTTAKVQGCNALGEPFEAITATVSASEVYFTITDQDVTQFAGNAKCEVVLTNGTNILGTANFIVAVEASPMGADVPAIYTNPVQAYIEGVVQDYVDYDVLPDVTAAINSKADASDVGDLSELETTDKTSLVGAVNELVSGKVDIAQGSGNAGKALVVNSSGNVEPGDIAIDIDNTLTQQGEAADAKATGDALALKANASIVASEFSTATSYTAGSYVLKNGVLYRFTAAHSGAWTGTDAETVTVGGEIIDLKADLKDTDRRIDFAINGSESSTVFIQGSRAANTYTEVVENPNRCTSANIFYVKKSDGFRVSCETEGVKYAIAGKYTSGSTYDSGWITGDHDIDSVADDIAIFVNFATSDGATPITPSDFVATITHTDNTSKLHDAYQDVNALLKETSDLQELIYDFHNLVNYNFDESCDYKSSGGATSSTRIGILRDKTRIVLNGGGVSRSCFIKLNDTVSRTNISSDVKKWIPSVLFRTGYTYKIKSTWTNGVISGTENISVPTISAYRQNTSTSVGTFEYSEDSKTFVRTVVGDGELYSIGVYVPAYYTFTDAEIYVTVEEIASYDIKDQYIAEMIDTIQKVRNEIDAPALVFPWVTDIHRYVASVQTFDDMINNIKAFAKHVKCDFVLNSGDTIQGDKSQTVSLGYAYDCIAAFKNIGEALMYSEGNHDNNPYISSGALTFTLKQVYSGFFSATKGVSFNTNENGTDYYFDFNGLGVRFISLNSCNSELATNYAYGSSTATWLANALNTDKKVIVVAHVSPIGQHVWNNNSPLNSADVSTALSDFVSRGGKLILLTGHSHVDAEFIEPYCEITSVCQKFEKADISTSQYEAITGEINGIRNPDRVEWTETADAWTVAIYKPMSDELSLIRFGAGVDRYIHCDPITPGTVTTKLSGTVTWKTSDANVATVADGVVTDVASGKCAIIAEDGNGNFEYWIINVV